MTARLPRSALHLVSASGGGMTRFARDLLGSADGHALLHAAADTWVLETGSGAAIEYTPYRVPSPAGGADWLDALLASSGCELLHVHYLHANTLPMLEAWSTHGRPWIASLHDVGFLSADAFASAVGFPPIDCAWSARWQFVLATASAITAPSEFLASAFASACPGLNADVVAPGVPEATDTLRRSALRRRVSRRSWEGRAAARPHLIASDPSRSGAAARRPPDARPPSRSLHSIAIVGALGAHKGKDRLLQWLADPAAARFRWTLIGYTEDQLQPGWIADGRLRVHGPFLQERTADWLRHYDVDLVLFPNRLAESFSYALSDVWAAGVPVLVPDVGALGERVRTHGGGAVLEHPDDAAAVHAQLAQVFEEGGAMLARWHAEIRAARDVMVPTTTSMVESMSRIYDQMPSPPATTSASPVAALQPFLRTQLDDTVFRHENIRLARDYAQLRAWADQLAHDVQRLKGDLGEVSLARGELDLRVAERDDAIAALRVRNERVERDAAALLERNHAVEADAAALSSAVTELTQRDATQAAAIAELSAHREHLNEQIGGHAARCSLLAETCDAQAGELALMRQRINALEVELRPLRIKGARYDRLLSWLPSSMVGLLRVWRAGRTQRRLARGAR